MHTRTPRIWLTLHVKKVHTAVCSQAPSAFLCGKQGVVLGVRERSEMFPQYQTFQLYVREVVLGALVCSSGP